MIDNLITEYRNFHWFTRLLLVAGAFIVPPVVFGIVVCDLLFSSEEE